jgi:predicted Rdx family selenoprotein
MCDAASMGARPKLTIEYCTQCNWMLRSAWMQQVCTTAGFVHTAARHIPQHYCLPGAQELLTTFNGTLAEVALKPNHTTGGVFIVTLDPDDGEGPGILWSRKAEGAPGHGFGPCAVSLSGRRRPSTEVLAVAGRFPESKELKQRVRRRRRRRRGAAHRRPGMQCSASLHSSRRRNLLAEKRSRVWRIALRLRRAPGVTERRRPAR